jgi:NADPH:quinone reductase-like Zn-dependent oxidoreductase
VKALAVGDTVGPIIDTEYISWREAGRSWLAAGEDGVMADHIVFNELVLCKLPAYLDWMSAATIPCTGIYRGVGVDRYEYWADSAYSR